MEKHQMEPTVVDAAVLEIKASRTRKPKNGKARPYKRKPLAAFIEEPLQESPEVPVPVSKDEGKVYGWPIKEGFAKIMIFSDHNDGNKTTFVPLLLGDHPRVQIAKNKMHVLPMGLVNIILDTTQEFPVDDLSDEMRPTRYFEKRPRFPHSEPIPATAAEYVAYRKEQEKLPHPNTLAKKT
jgi:hypothetical protein